MSLLDARFGDRVRSSCGMTQDTLESMATDAGSIDLIIHDAGHSRCDDVSDFEPVVGSVVLFDDTRG